MLAEERCMGRERGRMRMSEGQLASKPAEEGGKELLCFGLAAALYQGIMMMVGDRDVARRKGSCIDRAERG